MKFKKTAIFALLLLLFIVLIRPLYHNKQDQQTSFDYKWEMQKFVIDISQYSKAKNPSFIIIPQNGLDLIISNNQTNNAYLKAIDGFGQEPYLRQDDSAENWRADDEIALINQALKCLINYDKKVLLTDYTSDQNYIKHEMEHPDFKEAIHFFGETALDDIPTDLQQEYIDFNKDDVTTLSQAKNFLYLINPQKYPVIKNLIHVIGDTDYDLIIIDAFDNDGNLLTPAMIAQLKQKKCGAKRIVIAYLSIGEAENYRYYYPKTADQPDWLGEENPNWPGNYNVKYWQENWQTIIFGNDASYLDKIIELGFDGVYLDKIDSYEFYSNQLN